MAANKQTGPVVWTVSCGTDSDDVRRHCRFLQRSRKAGDAAGHCDTGLIFAGNL